MSQQELADRSGISKPTIANIERGIHKTVRLSTLEQLAESLHCDVTELMGEAAGEDAAAIEEFVQSEAAREIALQPAEAAWLRKLRISWPGRPPKASLIHLVEAFRYAYARKKH